MKTLNYLFCLLFIFNTVCVRSVYAGEEPSDQEISRAVDRELAIQRGLYASLIDVSVKDGIVMLEGTVDNMLEKEQTARVAETIRGVRGIINRIEIDAPDIEDGKLQKNIKDAWLNDPAADSYELTANVENGEVTITGTVQSWQEQQLAVKVAKGVRGVKSVNNQIEINYPAGDRSDLEIATEVKEALKWDSYVDETDIQVKVKNGKVKLSGIVGSEAEKNYAVSTAWVEGVKSIDNKDLEVMSWAKNENKRVQQYKITADKDIVKAVNKAFQYDPRVTEKPEVECNEGIVTLSGTVRNLRAKRAAIDDARNIVGVLWVKNYIDVRPEQKVADDVIEQNVRWMIKKNPYVDKYSIDVEAHGGIVFLNGRVDNDYALRQAEEEAESVNGVVAVSNNLQIRDDRYSSIFPYYYYSYKTYPLNNKSDRELKDDVVSQIWWSPFVDKDEVNVSVDNGTVELTGTVDTWRERVAAERNAFEGGAISVINHLEIDNHTYYR